MIKIPNTNYPVIDVIKNRWSIRSFKKDAISQDEIATLIEAASWAPSCNNEQPWQFYYVQKNNPEKFNELIDCLVTGNSLWAKEADVIIATVARKTFSSTGKPNDWASYDLGAANYGLLLQAQTMNIYGHLMAGFKPELARQVLGLTDSQEIMAFMVLGYLGDADALDEPFKTRELTPRSRKPIHEIAFKL